MKIEDNLKKIIKHDKDIENLGSQLDSIANNTDSLRPYKEKNIDLGFNAYWGDMNNDGTPKWVASKSQILGQLDLMEGIANEIALVIHISYLTAENRFIIIENIDNLIYSVEEAKKRNMYVKCLKFHCHIDSTILTKYGSDKFFTTYNNIISDTLDKFKYSEVEYAVAYNELNFIYSDSMYKDKVLSTINLIKNKKYKCLITVNDIWDFNSLTDEMIDMLDAVSVNLYPSLSNKLHKTTYEDCVYGWNKYEPFIKYLYSLDKKIIISEFGCSDNWEALNRTGGWSFPSEYKSYGKAPARMLYGFLNSELVNYIDSAWLWFYDNIYNFEEPATIAKNYVKGGN